MLLTLRRRQAASLALALAATGATQALPATASTATPAQAIASLNAQRAANGIPAGITERADLDAGCAHHNAYEQANGGALTHTEDPSKPGYTSDGAAAAQHSVLAQGQRWDTANPWEHAPIHLAQLLAPRLDVTGVDDSNGFTCAQTLASRNRVGPTTPTAYSYPGNGTTTIYPSETAREGPYTPGEKVGIPAGTATGPYLYVFFDGPWTAFAAAQVQSASLMGPAGAVPVATADNTTGGLVGYLPTGALIIPRSPLAPVTRYTASVTASVADYDSSAQGTHSYTWSFTTAAATTTTPKPNAKPTPRSTCRRAVRSRTSHSRRTLPVCRVRRKR